MVLSGKEHQLIESFRGGSLVDVVILGGGPGAGGCGWIQDLVSVV